MFFISLFLYSITISTILSVQISSDLIEKLLQTNSTDKDIYQSLVNEVNAQKTTTTTNTNTAKSEAIYLIVVILLYSLGALFVLISRVKPSSVNLNDYSNTKSTENLIKKMRDQTDTRKLLEQLKDLEFRKRAWSIYRKDSEGLDRRGSLFYIKNEQNILKNLEKKIQIIKKKEDTSFEMRHIGIHTKDKHTFAKSENREQMNKMLSEWSYSFKMKLSPAVNKNKANSNFKKSQTFHINQKDEKRDLEKSDYYFTIAGSSFQTSNQERKSILDTFKERHLSEEIKPSKSLPNLENILVHHNEQKQRFSIDTAPNLDKNVSFNSNKNVTKFF